MSKDSLIGMYKVTVKAAQVYPNQPERTKSIDFPVAYFSFLNHAQDFTNMCLNGYYTGVKIEKLQNSS